MFPNAFCSEGTQRFRVFDEQDLNIWHVSHCWDQVIVQIFCYTLDIFLHKGHSQSLGHTSLDLPLDLGWIDRFSYIMGRCKPQDSGGPQFQVHFHFSDMRSETISGIGRTLTVFIEFGGRRVEGSFTH